MIHITVHATNAPCFVGCCWIQFVKCVTNCQWAFTLYISQDVVLVNIRHYWIPACMPWKSAVKLYMLFWLWPSSASADKFYTADSNSCTHDGAQQCNPDKKEKILTALLGFITLCLWDPDQPVNWHYTLMSWKIIFYAGLQRCVNVLGASPYRRD